MDIIHFESFPDYRKIEEYLYYATIKAQAEMGERPQYV
jgi:hypothetical protein